MRQRTLILLLMSATLTWAQQHRTIEQERAEAEKASGGHQAQLYGDLALRTVDLADQQYAEGQSVKAQESIKQVLEYATRAHDLTLSSKKKMKEVEISLRLTQRRLEGVRHTLAAEDRPYVESVEKKLADFRQDILNAMFAPKGKEKA